METQKDKVDFRAYVLLSPSKCFVLMELGLTYEEIDSALYPLFLEERKQKQASIDSLVLLGKRIVNNIHKKIIKQKNRRKNELENL
jgi:hypothetical protein